jgi:SpoVK/Ycf46/Vps4 family AAA+-type ATPase
VVIIIIVIIILIIIICIIIGADCYALVREASLNAIRSDMLNLVRATAGGGDPTSGGGAGASAASAAVDASAFEAGGPKETEISMANFLRALERVKPSVAEKDVAMYESLRDSLH